MPGEELNIVQRIALLLLAIGLIYFGAYNHHFPWILFAVYALFDVLVFIWMILPVLKAGTLRYLKQANLFNKYRLPLLLIYSLAIYTGFVGMEPGSRDRLLVVLFWIVRVAAGLFLELIVVMKLLLDDVILKPEE